MSTHKFNEQQLNDITSQTAYKEAIKMNNTDMNGITQDGRHLVLPIAGKPTNGTVFPKEEKLVWKEMKRVIHGMVKNMSTTQDFRLVIPVWNKFDLEFLRASEIYGVPVTFILPYKTWGESRLPKFQTDLIIRMKQNSHNEVVIYKGKTFSDRVRHASLVADLIIGLDNREGMEQFYHSISQSDAETRPFPLNRMKYHTEEEGIEYLNKMSEESGINEMDINEVLPGIEG